MPIYEYRCRSCERRFEALLSRSDEAAPSCPACGGAEVEKLFSSFAVTRGRAGGSCGPCRSGSCSCCGD